ncbi:MAG: protein-disulfide reductase DsbD domain-containing protein, partial [Verrucomicrobiota bacterium]
MRFRTFLIFFACSLLANNLFAVQQTKVRLLLSAETAQPGETVFAAVQLKMPPGWHTYWTNSGDSGSATEIEWTLPPGITAGEVQWPVPEKNITPAGDLNFITYVYETEAVLLIPLKFAPSLALGEKTISAKVSWQECETVCVLGSKTLTASLVVANQSKPSAEADLIAAAGKKLPQTNLSVSISSYLETPSPTVANLRIDIAATTGQQWDFFPYNPKISGETKSSSPTSGTLRLQKEIKKAGADWPKEIAGVLVQLEKGMPAAGFEVTLTPAKPVTPTATSSAPVVKNPETKSLATMLLFAFIGGLLLNIMPCVLPVIALKVLSFVNQSKESPARAKMLGLIYGLGVLASFLVLALIAIGVKRAGEEASWGMALQNQTFRVVLTVLITL